MISILVAEDQTLLRGALVEILAREDDLEVVAECATGTEIVAKALSTRPDVAVLDIQLPGIDGLEAARELADRVPKTNVLMLTVFARPGYLRRAMSSGALGFIVKDTPPARLVDAIRRTARGERVVDPGLAAAALAHGESPLTARETEALAASRGIVPTSELAKTLFLSEGSVRNLLSTSMRKLGAHTRAEAASIAEEHGWL